MSNILIRDRFGEGVEPQVITSHQAKLEALVEEFHADFGWILTRVSGAWSLSAVVGADTETRVRDHLPLESLASAVNSGQSFIAVSPFGDLHMHALRSVDFIGLVSVMVLAPDYENEVVALGRRLRNGAYQEPELKRLRNCRSRLPLLQTS